jgi:hypothetical protein
VTRPVRRRRPNVCRMGQESGGVSCEQGGIPQPAVYMVSPAQAGPLAVNGPGYYCAGCAESQAKAYIGWGWGAIVLPLTEGGVTT